MINSCHLSFCIFHVFHLRRSRDGVSFHILLSLSLFLSLFLSNIRFLSLYFHISIKFMRSRSEFNIRLILLYSLRQIVIARIAYILTYYTFVKQYV